MADADELYETDFYAWTRREVRNLKALARTRPNMPVDLPHIIEEIDDLGSERRFAVESLTMQIMRHLLLLEYSPAREPVNHWRAEVGEFRAQLEDRLTRALANQLRRRLDRIYVRARSLAEDKLLVHHPKGPLPTLPVERPYSFEQVTRRWFPAGIDG